MVKQFTPTKRRGLSSKRVLAYAAAAAIAGSATSEANADYVGAYAPGNWILDNDQGGDGNVGSHDAITAILNGANDDGGITNVTTYTTTAASDGTVQFDWTYTTSDSGSWDYAGFVLNGVFTTLAFNSNATANDTFSAAISSGDSFGFFVTTKDGGNGPGVFNTTNFNFNSIPEPSAMGILALGAAAVATRRRRKSNNS